MSIINYRLFSLIFFLIKYFIPAKNSSIGLVNREYGELKNILIFAKNGLKNFALWMLALSIKKIALLRFYLIISFSDIMLAIKIPKS